jgi:signal transduction histidine kinase
MEGTPLAISEPVAHDLLMTAREAVYNAMLHGHPAHVSVALTYKSRELFLNLDDDGCGFNPGEMDSHHFGLKGMKERVERSGGKFHLTTALGNGVHIEVRLPHRR